MTIIRLVLPNLFSYFVLQMLLRDYFIRTKKLKIYNAEIFCKMNDETQAHTVDLFPKTSGLFPIYYKSHDKISKKRCKQAA